MPLVTEVTLSAPDHKHPKWAKIVAITHGKVVANDVAKPLDPAAQTGYVFIPDLDSITTPESLDSVVATIQPQLTAKSVARAHLGARKICEDENRFM